MPKTQAQTPESPEATEATTEATEATEAVEAAASGSSQGGRTKTAVVIYRDDSTTSVEALKSPDGLTRVTRESLLEHPEAVMVWDFAIEQWNTAKRLLKATSGVLEASNHAVSKMQHLCANLTSATCAASAELSDGLERDDADEPNAPLQLPQLPQPPQHAPLVRPFELRAGGVGYVGYGPDRWQRKKIGRKSVAKRLKAYHLELVVDERDLNGDLYQVGEKSHATYCGAFPHALIRHKVGPHKDNDVFACSGGLEVVLTLQLRCDLDGGQPKTECHVLDELRRACTEDELLHGWGEFEESLRFYVELQFACDDVDLDSLKNWVCADVANFECNAFKKTPPGKMLLSPPEHVPYTKGRQEMHMVKGKAETQFGFNQHVTTTNLCGDKTKNLFRFAIRCLNPYLNGLDSFQVVSKPFVIKRSLHNNLTANERWVKNAEGALTKVPVDDVVRFAPARPGAAPKRGGGGGGGDGGGGGEAAAPLVEEEE